ncbi:cysteine hydrolase [Mesorhizobium mediterraneum]|uniref:Isochorismatase n=1 Tax=Mesorhizobium mediterraneum TaxID=43617 RepID=A0AB36RG62_9HYPH|nr:MULTISPECIES: isochorismatase family cysteine hydrolase [Mesorhizobium]AZO64230.1 cysteine hydrolase [Mesorhizobium sp. M6A.T.Cr.TU.016.01.1.1]PAQ03330.1 isochorismatase [Mesorhizobium mediterraneum]RUU30834.1 cysteine hydrolase [Mesorhizobium sp. M6A.T.Ce.TU.016.01.1.1]RWN45001.1 MAG: cysteine hydrolase [Mesorhizobium sp.]RWN67757.1 MAG: cysteine hydrolase [Mesorhizobium sp.]
MPVDSFSSHRHDDAMRLDPQRAAVIVIDMVNEFCKPGGAMVLPGYETLVAPQLAIIEAARADGVPVIWVHDTHRAGMRREREWVKRTPHCLEGSWGPEIIEDLGARDDEIHLIKRRYSAFFQTDLDLTLKDMQVDQLVIFGVVTNICVRSTVHDAFFQGYEVVVPSDCCAATGPREQESSLYDIATHFGVVSDSASVVAALRDGTSLQPAEVAA